MATGRAKGGKREKTGGKPAATPDRILETARRLFNSRGYAATSLAEIAAEAGISQGNLSYHFPSKKDLATGIQDRARLRMRTRQEARTPGPIADDYVEHLLFAMALTWDYRFAMRDRAQFLDADRTAEPIPEMAADLKELSQLLARLKSEGGFRRTITIDLPVLARTLWIVSRYWLDHLGEIEGLRAVTWDDQRRGIEQHLAMLTPYLTAAAHRDMQNALHRAATAPASAE